MVKSPIAKAGGLLFTDAEVEALNELAEECGMAKFEVSTLANYDV